MRATCVTVLWNDTDHTIRAPRCGYFVAEGRGFNPVPDSNIDVLKYDTFYNLCLSPFSPFIHHLPQNVTKGIQKKAFPQAPISLSPPFRTKHARSQWMTGVRWGGVLTRREDLYRNCTAECSWKLNRAQRVRRWAAELTQKPSELKNQDSLVLIEIESLCWLSVTTRTTQSRQCEGSGGEGRCQGTAESLYI
jgi:hypothetical protein